MLKALIILCVFIILLVPVMFFMIKHSFAMCTKKIKGNGNIKIEERQFPKFNAILVSNVFTVKLKCGEEQKVVISCDENLVPYIKTKVVDTKLKIYSDENLYSTDGLNIAISAKNIKEVSLSGAVTVEAEGIFEDKLELKMSGASKATLSGEAINFIVKSSGACKIEAENLLAEKVYIKASGACKASVFAAKLLDVNASGASKVTYKGNPETVKQSVSGVGKITKE
jgi:hypothetical protein